MGDNHQFLTETASHLSDIPNQCSLCLIPALQAATCTSCGRFIAKETVVGEMEHTSSSSLQIPTDTGLTKETMTYWDDDKYSTHYSPECR